LPDARVGDRQRTCGAAACQQRRREQTHAEWRTRNPDYDRDRRWRDAIAVAKSEPDALPNASRAAAPVTGVPWEVVQDEMTVEARVILTGVVRVLGRYVQTEMRRQDHDLTQKSGRHAGRTAQTEMEVAR
jgi:hypothetical protein